MNADLETLLQKLNEFTQEYPTEQVMTELRVIAERLTFAQINPDNLAERPMQQKEIEFLLNHDISPQVLEFIRYLMKSNMLGILTDQIGQVFLDHCQTSFSRIKQLVFKTAIPLGDVKKQQIRLNLKRIYPVDTRILFDVEPGIMAGFVLEDMPKTYDYSLHNQVGKLLETFIRRQVARTN